MATITTRSGKGSPLTNSEVDSNFSNINIELGQKESASNKGVANGYASLDGSGKVPSAQLPSYVDDVVEGANLAALPATGETGKIYVTLDTNKTYRWSGSAYVEISASPGSTDAVTEGSTNLYFTNARARGALSGNAPISYNSTSGAISHAVSGVTAGSYGSSTSVPVITVDATGHVTGVSTSSISGSLTFTGDVTGSGSTGSSTALTLANSGVVAGTYTKVTVDAKGRVTTGASLASGDLPTYTGTITSSQVTTALGFTPYNSSNPSGYITSSALSSYLPLSGGTLSGAVSAPNFHDANGLYNVNLGGINGRGAAAGYSGGAYGGVGYNVRHTATAEQYVAPTGDTVSYLRFDSGGFRFFSATVGAAGRTVTLSGSGNAFLDASGNWYAAGQMYATGSQHLVLNTGNYSSYALPLSGGTLTGNLVSSGTARFSGATIAPYNGVYGAEAIGATSGNKLIYLYNNGTVLKLDAYDFGTSTPLNIKICENGGIVTLNTGANVNGSTILHAGNYTSYSPSLTGSGASGTWGISITGNAATTSQRNFTGDIASTGQGRFTGWYDGASGNNALAAEIGVSGGSAYILSYNRSTSTYGTLSFNAANIQLVPQGGSLTGPSSNVILHAGNYSSYALPLSGGTISGAIRAPQITAGGSTNTDANLGVQGTAHLTGTIYYGGAVGNVNSWSSISTSSSGTHTFSGSRFIFDRYGYGSQPLIDMQSGSITLSQPTYATNGITVNDAAANGRGINLYSGSPTSPTYGLFFAQTGNFGTYGAVSADWATYFTMNSTAHRGWIFREHDSLGNVAAISNQGNMTIRSHFEQGNNIARPNVSWSASSTSTGMVIFYLPGTTSNYGMVHMVFDIYEYNSNAVSTVIVGGHNWSTSWYNTSANVIGQCGKEVRLGCKNGRFCVVFGTSGSVWEYGTIVLRKIHNGSFYDNIMNMVGDWESTQTTTESFTNITGDLRALRTPASFNAGGSITQAGNQVLHAGNYSSYAVALSGDQSIAGTKTFTTQIRTNRVEGTDGAFLFKIGIQSGTTRHLNLSDSTTDPASATTSIVGITWGSRDDTNPYYLIYPHYYSNGYSTHNRLRLAWHTGIEIGAASGYGGTRFFNNSPFAGSEIFSVGKGDDNVRVANSLYVQGDSRGQDVYTTGGWFRNHTNNNGIYWSQTGWHLYPADAGNFYVRSGTSAGSLLFLNSGGSGLGYVHAAADAAMGFLNTSGNWRLRVDNSGNTTCYNNLYLNQNYGHGHVGLYDSYRYQGVFFMGDAYKMSADGTSLANMYGIGWSHPNAGGAAGNLTDHGMLIINNGSFRCAISNSIVASGNITAYSDERLKKNWRDMPDNFVERLAQVRNGCYERIDDGMEQVGVSAQSLQKLLPEAILTAKDEIGTLSVSYGNAAMASAVELAKELVMLKKELAEIKSRLH